MVKRFTWLLGAALGLGALVAQSGCSAGKGPADSPPGSYAIGQPVTLGGAEVTITAVMARAEVGKGAARQQAAPGDVLIVIRDDVKNVGPTPLPAPAGPRVALVDPAGVIHPADPAKTAAYLAEGPTKSADQPLAVKATIEGAWVFEVPIATYPKGWAIALGDGTRKVELK